MTSAVKPSPANANTGTLVVVGMLLVATLAGGFAWWWNYDRGRRALGFYGPEAARLIRTAPQVEILVVAESNGAEAPTGDRIPEMELPIGHRIDISSAPGLIHARTALLDDASYEWDAFPIPQVFTYFVRFADGDDDVVLAFSEPDAYVLPLTSVHGSQSLTSKTADGWRAFIERNLAASVEP